LYLTNVDQLSLIMKTMRKTAVPCIVLILAALNASAADAGKAQSVAPLFSGMGELHHPVTTRSMEAQRFFDQGLTLCYAFNHPEAIRSFRGALKHDPDCAMAWWGIAYASGPHVNRPMTREDNDRAWDAIQKALALKSKVGASDQAYIDSMAMRYQAEFNGDRPALDKAWAAAMREVAANLPDDPDAKTIMSEAIMDTMPWDYWKSDRSPKPETEEAFAALRSVLQRHPDHPGANHFYIHAVEAGPNPEWGLPSADRLGKLVPQAGHLVHMPSHIYFRVGQYHDATVANELAVKADRSYIQHCAAQGFYPGVYYPHNEHFLWYALLFEGRSGRALDAAKRVAETANDNYCGPNKALEAPRFRHLPWLTMARFGRWKDILAVAQPPSTNDFLIDRAFWHFTRGLAFAARGDGSSASAEHAALAKLATSEDAKKLDNPHFPATGVLAVAEHWLAGKAAEANGNSDEAIRRLTEAVKAEDALPYMEPSYWPVPVRPTLGAVLLKAGKPAEAEKYFREDLSRWRRNAWGLLGLEASLRAQGNAIAADMVHREFEDAWQRADVKLDLAWF
jgi:Tfp pilus assembly protein PilF